jgi:hypothetical protein
MTQIALKAAFTLLADYQLLTSSNQANNGSSSLPSSVGVPSSATGGLTGRTISRYAYIISPIFVVILISMRMALVFDDGIIVTCGSRYFNVYVHHCHLKLGRRYLLR